MEDNKENILEQYMSKTIDNQNQSNSDIKEIKRSVGNIEHAVNKNDLEFINIDLSILPCGLFYQKGTQIKIRAALVEEVQAYSIVDDRNPIDVVEKMYQLLSSCVRIFHHNGTRGSYRDIREPDKFFLIFMIRELTFQKGNSFAKDIKCEFCSHEFKVVYRTTSNQDHPKTFVNYEMPLELQKYYNSEEACYHIPINNTTYKLAPPTIGINEIVLKELKDRLHTDNPPNLSFLKFLPFLLWDRITITPEGLKAKEQEHRKGLDMQTFQILNKVIDKMIFGVKELSIKCPSCGQEVHTPMTFPTGAAGIFAFSDSLTELIG